MNSKKSKIIGFDLDDVLLNFSDSLIMNHNKLYGTNHTRDDKKSYFLEQLWNCDREETIKRIDDFFLHDDHDNSLPVEGSVEGIAELKKDHTLFVITAKPESLREKTLAWIDTYFPETFKAIHFANHFHGVNKKRPKSEVCLELGIEIFVDDALENAHDIAGAGIPMLLLDTPWNQGEVPPLVTRVCSWKEIVEKINQ